MPTPTSDAAQDTLTDVTFVDVDVTQGNGGETRQQAGDGAPQLTTQQGAPVSDDQNSLKIGARGPVAKQVETKGL